MPIFLKIGNFYLLKEINFVQLILILFNKKILV